MPVRRCPRCRGRMFLEEDGDDMVWKCLQCGRTKVFMSTQEFRARVHARNNLFEQQARPVVHERPEKKKRYFK